jgi:hypothetical protein
MGADVLNSGVIHQALSPVAGDAFRSINSLGLFLCIGRRRIITIQVLK